MYDDFLALLDRAQAAARERRDELAKLERRLDEHEGRWHSTDNGIEVRATGAGRLVTISLGRRTRRLRPELLGRHIVDAVHAARAAAARSAVEDIRSSGDQLPRLADAVPVHRSSRQAPAQPLVERRFGDGIGRILVGRFRRLVDVKLDQKAVFVSAQTLGDLICAAINTADDESENQRTNERNVPA